MNFGFEVLLMKNVGIQNYEMQNCVSAKKPALLIKCTLLKFI